MKVRLILSLAGLVAASACVPAPEAPQQPQPTVPPAPAPAPPPPPAGTDWRDIPLTSGDWSYAAEASGGSAARFGPAGAPLFTLRCDRARQVHLIVPGAVQGAMTVRTSFGARNLPLRVSGGQSEAALASGDALLDSIAFSRGRFTIEVPGQRMLVIPAWAEPARVVEDCRS